MEPITFEDLEKSLRDIIFSKKELKNTSNTLKARVMRLYVVCFKVLKTMN